MIRKRNKISKGVKKDDNDNQKSGIGVIKPREITEEMQESYIDYAMSVIVARALPDVRDGLKPVHRRILYAMRDMGLTHTAKFRKSATVTGEVLGKYHPHGDMAVYDSMARMAQDFSLRYPLIDGQGNWGCFTKDTKIRLTDGRSVSFKDLIKEQREGKQHWTFSFNQKTQKIEIAEIKNPRLTRKKEKIMEVTLDNNERIRCTLDHRFMLRDGNYKKAQDLKPDDSLMPLYTKLYNGEDKNLKGYELIFQPVELNEDFIHRLSDKWNLENGVYKKSAGRIRHHKDFNKLNNNPNNILRIQWQDHWKYHKEIASERHKNDPEYVKKLAEGRRKFIENNREVFSQRAKNLNKKLWASSDFRKRHTEQIKEMWRNPEYKEFMRKNSSKNLKNLWQRKDFQGLLSKLKSEEMKKRWQDADFRAMMAKRMRQLSLKLWSIPAHRKYISKIMIERLKGLEARKRVSEIMKLLWQSPEYRVQYSPDYFSKMAKKLWEDPKMKQFHREKILRQRENPEFINKNKAGLKRLYIQRIGENPNYMRELTEKAKIALSRNWQNPSYREKVIRSKILRYVFNLSRKYSKITPKIYEKERTNNWIPGLANALSYFSNFDEIVKQAPKYNHKVIKIKILKNREDVYDLTVNPWHNFALASGVFVHNSIDDPGEFAAMRYCITGDSFIITNHCLEKIEEVSIKEDINLKVLSFGGKINSASKWFDSGIHPTIKIKTFRGYELRGSFNHPILTLQSDIQGKPVFKWKLLNEIKEGDFAVIDRSNQVLWPESEPDLKKYYPNSKNRRAAIYKLPSLMSLELAFLLGAIVAEGYVSHKKSGEKCIGFCNTDKKFISVFKKNFKKVFPDCRLHEFERKPLSYGKQKFTALEIHSTYITEFLENLGLKRVPSSEKQTPQIIFHSTKESVAAFLRGFVEGDGSIYICKYRKGDTKRKSIEITFISTSEKLLKELQVILLRFGMESFLRFEKTRKMWRLFIHGHNNLNLFKQQIGFVSQKKMQRLRDFSEQNSDNRIMSKTDFIPFLSDYLRKKYKISETKPLFRKWLKGHNLDRYPKILKYFSILKRGLQKEDFELINCLSNQHYLFDKVISTEANGKERVFSIRVDSGCHSFVSNGFISHNTECRLSKIGEETLKDIEKETVDFVDNYDGTRKEPVVLPSPLPQLLLNGSLGIAVGMATDIPTHNLSEVCDAAIYLIDNQKADTEDLFKFIQGPDFPTGGIIYDQKAIIQAYSQGKGPIVVRGKAEVQEQEKTGRLRIIVSEIPFHVQKSTLIEQFANLVSEKKIEGIKDIRDESDKDGMRIVIELPRDSYPQKVLNQLYKFTDLQRTFHLNMLALVDGIQPRVLNLAEVLGYFLEHRKEVVRKRTQYDLKKAKERAHILEGLHKCLANIDAVIRTIKNSASREDAEKNLMKKFKLTEIQANAILETKLAALAKLERKKIEDELKELKEIIKELAAILKSPQRIKNIIKKELKALKDGFRDTRKTKVHNQAIGEIAEEDLVPKEETVITLTQGGYIKRINPKTYKIQNRGGKGILGMKTLQDDTVSHFLSANTHDSLLFFTDSGKVFRTQVYEIPEGQRVARGRGLLNFLEIVSTDKILSLFPIKKEDIDYGVKYLVMVTQDGIIKKTSLAEFENVRRSGLIAITLKKDDLLKKIEKSTGEDEIILVTKKGIAIRFREKQVREMGRPASGTKGIRLKGGDEVIGMDVIQIKKSAVSAQEKLKTKNEIMVLSENGYGKKTDLKEYRLQGRGGAGVKTAKVTPKTGNLVASFTLTGEEEDLIVISQKGQVIRTNISQIPKLSRSTQGVRLMRLEEGDKVASATCI